MMEQGKSRAVLLGEGNWKVQIKSSVHNYSFWINVVLKCGQAKYQAEGRINGL